MILTRELYMNCVCGYIDDEFLYYEAGETSRGEISCTSEDRGLVLLSLIGLDSHLGDLLKFTKIDVDGELIAIFFDLKSVN
jgi:hypothetical protein